MTGYGEIIEPGTLRFERLLPAPPETVWAFLVEPEKRARWLCGGAMELRPGGGFEMIFDNMKLSEPGDLPPEKYRHEAGEIRMHSRILDCEAPRLLVLEWIEPEGAPGAGGASEVTFELMPRAGQTLLVLTHRRLQPGEQMEGVSAGWHAHLDVLASRVGGGNEVSFWRHHTALEAEYRARLAAD